MDPVITVDTVLQLVALVLWVAVLGRAALLTVRRRTHREGVRALI